MSLVFTLCSSKAYWPKAQVAVDAIKRYHPEVHIDLRNEECDFPRKRMQQVLDWLEKGHQVIALGADCVLYSPLSTKRILNQVGTNIVLTPHVVNFPTERVFELYDGGHANGDCIGLNPTFETIEAVKWVLAQPLGFSKGQFFEQTPLSSLPFLMSGVVINRDFTINVAWYNLHERNLQRTENGLYTVCGWGLAMFQFSGYDSKKLSTHWPNPVITPVLQKLMTEYEMACQQHAQPS